MAGLKDIAEKVGVSIATVSMVLNNKKSKIAISEERKVAIRKAADELGYKPNYHAKFLRMQKSNLIGVIVWDMTDPYFSLILKGIESELKRADFQIIIANADEDDKNIINSFENLQNFFVDGVIILGGGESLDEESDAKKNFSKPVINVGRYSGDLNEDNILIDNLYGGTKGAEYLLGLNKDKLVYIGRKIKTFDEKKRLEGFLKGVEGKTDFDVIETNSSSADAHTSMYNYLKENKGSVSIFAEDDIIALGVIQAVKQMELSIPGDTAVIGFDDLVFAEYLDPRLTTFKQPRIEMGIQAARILIEKNNDPSRKPQTVTLKPELVVRDSS